MADASIVPTYLLSKFTRENVTVALGGDGGDELFCGYDTFLAHKLASAYRLINNKYSSKALKWLASILPTSFNNMSLDFKIKKFINDFDNNIIHRNQNWLGAFTREEMKGLLASKFSSNLKDFNRYEIVDSYARDTDSQDDFDRLTHVYERTYMMDQVLVKVDRASMFNSLEVRAPILDTRVVELANHLPLNFKLRGMTRKFIFKKLMEGKLPKDIIYRKKKGFGMPIAEWIRGGLKPLVLKYLGRDIIIKQGIFNPDYIEGILSDHFSGSVDNRKKIWTLLCFSLWYDGFMNK
jgi:asparagine synthase (glutamine-hydrolysing)